MSHRLRRFVSGIAQLFVCLHMVTLQASWEAMHVSGLVLVAAAQHQTNTTNKTNKNNSLFVSAGNLLPWAAFFHLMFSVWAFSWAKWPQENHSKLADSIFGTYVRKVGKCCPVSLSAVQPEPLPSAWASEASLIDVAMLNAACISTFCQSSNLLRLLCMFAVRVVVNSQEPSMHQTMSCSNLASPGAMQAHTNLHWRMFGSTADF